MNLRCSVSDFLPINTFSTIYLNYYIVLSVGKEQGIGSQRKNRKNETKPGEN